MEKHNHYWDFRFKGTSEGFNEPIEPAKYAPANKAEQKESDKVLQKALFTLTVRQQLIISMYADGQSIEDIGLKLKIAKGTVQDSLERSRAKLKGILGEYFHDFR